MASIPSTHRTAVFFDGACPLCRKEIGWYRRRRGAEAIDWVDLSQVRTTYAAPDLLTADALKRFHVRLPDGRLVSGGGAFAELWARLPTFTLLGRVMRTRAMAPALELFYRGFLRFRPVLQRLMSSQVACSSRYPKWLERELRSDHAGETGAVSIYPWKGKVESTEECLLLLKTPGSVLRALEKRLHELHSYECPEFVALEAAHVSADYAAWVESSVKLPVEPA